MDRIEYRERRSDPLWELLLPQALSTQRMGEILKENGVKVPQGALGDRQHLLHLLSTYVIPQPPVSEQNKINARCENSVQSEGNGPQPVPRFILRMQKLQMSGNEMISTNKERHQGSPFKSLTKTSTGASGPSEISSPARKKARIEAPSPNDSGGEISSPASKRIKIDDPNPKEGSTGISSPARKIARITFP